MNLKLIDFLKQLDDKELQVFYYYRYNEFLPDSRSLINNEFKIRNLNSKEITTAVKLKSEIKLNTTICKRCGSQRFIDHQTTEIKVSKFAADEVVRKEYICLLCNKVY